MRSTIETIKDDLLKELESQGVTLRPTQLSPLELAKENEGRGVYKLLKEEEQQLLNGSIVDLVILNYFKHFKKQITTVEKTDYQLLNIGKLSLKKPWLITRMPFLRERVERYKTQHKNTPLDHPLYEKRKQDVVRLQEYYNELWAVLPLIKDIYENGSGKGGPEKKEKIMKHLQTGKVETYNLLIKLINEGPIEIKSEHELNLKQIT